MIRKEILGLSAIGLLLLAGVVYLGTSVSLKTDSTQTSQTVQSSSQPTDSELSDLTEKIQQITFLDSDDKEKTVADFKGKPSIVVFWASWCPDCQAQLPILADLYNKYKKDVNFIFLNAVDGTRETKEKGQQYFAEKYKFDYYQDKDMTAASAMGVTNIPTMFLLDSKQNVVQFYRVNQTKETLDAALKALK